MYNIIDVDIYIYVCVYVDIYMCIIYNYFQQKVKVNDLMDCCC